MGSPALNIQASTSNVGIGTTSPTAQLHTTGTVRFQNYPNTILTTDANGNLQPGALTIAGTTNQIDVANGNFQGGNPTVAMDPAYTAAVKSPFALTGGGNILFDGGEDLSWSQRFIVICNGSGPQFSQSGYFDINMPAQGTTIPGLAGVGDRVVGPNGIQISGWDALYYILPIGGNSSSQDGNFRIVSYGSGFVQPENWLLLALVNGDDQTVRLGNGAILQPGQTWTSGLGTAQNGSNNFVLNGTSQQNANFNVSGTGVVGGNMGVGITDPQAKLTVIAGGNDPGGFSSGKALYVTAPMNEGKNYDGAIEFRHDNNTQGIGFGYNTMYATGYNTDQELNIMAKGGANLTLQTYGGAYGNVGINTASPSAKLDVNGTVRFDNYTNGVLSVDGSGNLGVANSSSLINAGNGLSYSGNTLNSVWSNNGSSIYNNNPGGVGIGTNSPNGSLQVLGGAAQFSRFNQPSQAPWVSADIVVGDGSNPREGYNTTYGSNIFMQAVGKNTISAVDLTSSVGQIAFQNHVWTIGEDVGWGTQVIRLPNLANNGNKIVQTDNSGNLYISDYGD